MPLRRSPLLTPRSLAARRANALKSTGPRTECGKARVSLNALKHGHGCGPAGRPARFRERLLRAGFVRQEALYEELRGRLAQAMGARHPHWRTEVDRFALRAWCMAMGRDSFRTKLESPLDSVQKGLWVLAQDACFVRSRRTRPGFARSLRYQAQDNYRRIGVAFWIQRRRYITRARTRRIMAGLERFRVRAADEGLEGRVRCLVFRMRRPGYDERMYYGLDRNGDPDWSREPWRSMPAYRQEWEAARRGNRCGGYPEPAGGTASVPTGPACESGTHASTSHAGSGRAVEPARASNRGEGFADRIREAASRVFSRVSRWVS